MSDTINKATSCKLRVDGLDCADCATKLERDLQNVGGIHNARINFISKVINVEFDPDRIDRRSIEKEIDKFGYKIGEKTAEQEKDTTKSAGIIPTLISGMAAVVGGILSFFDFPDILTIPILSLAISAGGYRIVVKGIKAALNRSLDMNFLMTAAVIGAMFLGEWSEGAMVIFLFSLSNLLESRSMERARKAIGKLLSLSPKIATVIEGESETTVPVESVVVGQTILIKPGEAIPLDGEVIGGKSSVNQAPITGESTPVKKKIGEEVFAGSVNGSGVLRVKATKPYSDSTLSRIIHLVEEAQSRRAPVQLFVDKFAGYYTPLVVAGAALLAVIPPLLLGQEFQEWFYRALVLLVIACPCALVISTPVSFVSGLTVAARNGVLIKGGSFLEIAAQIDTVALDKTGTVTYGEPRLVEIIPFNNTRKDYILSIAASLEKYSGHPLAKAIIEYAHKQNADFKDVEQFTALPGSGVKGVVGGEKFYLANHPFFEKMGLCDNSYHKYLNDVENSNQTAVFLGTGEKILGLLAVADAVREEAVEAVTVLKDSFITKVFIVSGDNHRTTKAVSEKIGSDEYFAELLPEHKLEIIRNKRTEGLNVAMVGDGINDAPALASANLGIAMGSGGTDVALETADVAIIGDDLLKLPYFFKLSRRILGIIKQNIILAIGIKAVFVILTIMGLSTLWMAVFADMGASLIVISNSLRILNTRF